MNQQHNYDDDPELRPIDNPAEWDAITNEGLNIRHLGTTISVRLDRETAQLIRRAARAQNQTQAEFLRAAAVAHAEQVLKITST
jgi:hypothetical protein